MMRGFTTDLRRIELLAGIDTRTHCILGEGSSAACRCGRTFETFEQGLLHVDEIGMYGENEDAFGQIEQPFARVYFLRESRKSRKRKAWTISQPRTFTTTSASRGLIITSSW